MAAALRPAGPDVVTTHDDLVRLDGRRVVACGRYVAVVRPRKGPDDPEAPRDHAVVTLADATQVWLEPTKASTARRSAAETRRCDGRDVRVTGVARLRMPASGESLIAPCLQDVEDVEVIE